MMYPLSMATENYRKALEEIDVLVDGRFVLELRSFDAQFRYGMDK